jgi:lysophospholipase L1-like esterase
MKEVISHELQIYQEDRLDYFKKDNLKQKMNGIVFTGDSIIEFYPLKKFLGRDLPLINRGIAGTDSGWLLKHLDEQVIKLNPQKVFILVGTNDLGLGYDISVAYNNIIAIISEIKKVLPQTQVFILSLLPVNESSEYEQKVKIRKNEMISKLNGRLSAILEVNFINTYPDLVDNKNNLSVSYTTDGLHLSQEGYQIFSNNIKQFL